MKLLVADLEGADVLEHRLQFALGVQRGDLVTATDALAADKDARHAPGPGEAPHVVLQERGRRA